MIEFGALIPPHPRVAPQQARFLEDQGFTHAFIGDVPLCGGDVYACMALAAAATRRIKFATHIAIAPMRDAPVIVHSIATVNALAPGRVTLGFGSGSFTRCLMGLPPVKLGDFREALRQIRGLLDTGEATIESEGLQRKIRFYGQEFGCVNLEQRIPLFVAASSPKAATLAGQFADGVITTGLPTPEQLTALLGWVTAGARAVGRDVGRLPCVLEGPVCVVRRGETLESARVIEAVGAWVTVGLKFYAASQAPTESLPAPVRRACDAFRAQLARLAAPAEERHLAFWDGVFTVRPDERRFVTPEVIRAMTICGPCEEVSDHLKMLERAGMTRFCVWLPQSGVDEYLVGLHEAMDRL